MKINTNSWHYKFRNLLEFSTPDNLCQYIRQIVLTAVFFPLLTFLALLFTVLTTAPIWHLFIDTTIGVVIMGGIIDIAILFVFWGKHRENTYDKRNYGKISEPGIIRLWLHARHRNICPLLEYETDKVKNAG